MQTHIKSDFLKPVHQFISGWKSVILLTFLVIVTESTINPSDGEIINLTEVENTIETDTFEENENDPFCFKSHFFSLIESVHSTNHDQVCEYSDVVLIEFLIHSIEAPPPELRI